MRLQRTLYDRLRVYARDYLGNLRPELRKYFLEYQREFAEIKGVSTKQELLSEFTESQVAICGDYHTLAQAQRTVIRLLRESLPELRKRGRRVILALEMIRFRDTPRVARFQDGRLCEEEFLRSIAFEKNWGFHWDNYRQLFEFAREMSIPIVGLNTDSRRRQRSLRERDRFAARVIGTLCASDKSAMVMALIGDLHLASPHLPAALQQDLKRRSVERRVMVIHQNHERLYWKLAARSLEGKVDVVKLRDGVFCVMNTPPWVKLQSYLRWQELETPEDVEFGDEIRELLNILRQFLGFPEATDDDFKLASPGDLGFLENLTIGGALSRRALRVLVRCLLEFDGLFIPGPNIIFLASLSINQAAAQAAIFLHAKSSGFRRVFSDPREDFYPFVWIEALGFLGSKIINPSRKCADSEELQRMADRHGRPSASKVAAATLRHLRAEESFLSRGTFRSPPIAAGIPSSAVALFYYQIARRLGQLLGQRLYFALMQEKISREDVRALYATPFETNPSKDLYLRWVRKLHTVKVDAATQ